MRRWTARQRVLAGGVALLWILTVVAAVVAAWQVVAILVATTLLLAVIGLVDARSTDARVVAKLDVLTRRTAVLPREVDKISSVATKQIRAARRAVEQAGSDSLDEIATFKLQLGAVVEQLAELNRRVPGTDLEDDLRHLSTELSRLQVELTARHQEVLDQSGAVELSVRSQAQLVRAQVRATAVQLGSLHHQLEQVTGPADPARVEEAGHQEVGSQG